MRTLQPQPKANKPANNAPKKPATKIISKTSFFAPQDFSLDILSEGDSARLVDSLNNYVRECRGYYGLTEYVDFGSKNPKQSEIKQKVQSLNMKHILIGLRSIARNLRHSTESFESVILIYDRPQHDLLEEVMQLCNRKGVRLILVQKSQKKRLMDLTGMKKINGLAILKFDKTEKYLDTINEFSSKCNTNFTWTINPNEFKPLRLKVQTIEKEITPIVKPVKQGVKE